MATWQNTSLLMLRTMLNDAGCGESKYSNDRLEDLLITAAYLLPIDVNFNTTYTVDVEAYSISPDPIGQTDGTDFISFMVLKAACIADEGNFRTSALLQGVSARCGPASITTANYGAYLKEAVMSPFAANDFDPGNQLGQLGQADLQNPIRQRGY
jgi:hypothetical protein